MVEKGVLQKNMLKKTDYDIEKNKSLVSTDKCCFFCGTKSNLHRHHIFNGPNRQKSDIEGMWAYLCGPHHNLSGQGVHFNKELDLKLKKHAEKIWIEHNVDPYASRDNKIKKFISIFGKNYLDEEDF